MSFSVFGVPLYLYFYTLNACNITLTAMKRITIISLNRSVFFFACLVLLAGCRSSGITSRGTSGQHYALRVVKPQRLEVTSALDSNPVSEVFNFLSPYQASVDSLQRPYVGRSAQFMAPSRPESLLSNWVADALVAEGERLGYHPDMGLCNMGGLRSTLPKDTVRRGDVIAVAPFENYFTILEMKGSDMLRLMQNIAAVHGEGVSHSVRLRITSDGQLQNAAINGQAIDPDNIYIVATIDYLAYGNDKMYALKDAQKRIVTERPVRDVLMDCLRSLDERGQMASAEIEGRIVVTD